MARLEAWSHWETYNRHRDKVEQTLRDLMVEDGVDPDAIEIEWTPAPEGEPGDFKVVASAPGPALSWQEEA